MVSDPLQPQNVEHIVFAGFLVLTPNRGFQRTLGKQAAVGGHMAQNDPFAGTGKQHIMFADDIAAANRAKADCAALTGTGDAVAAPIRHIRQRHTAPGSGSLAQHQRGAGGRIDLFIVMCLDHFNVEILVQCGGDHPGQFGQQVDPKAHIAGAHDHRVAGRGVDFFQIAVAEPGGADHMHGAGLCRQGGKCHRRGRGGEIQHRLRCRKNLQRIIADRQPKGCAAHCGAKILADPGVADLFDGTDQPRLGRGQNRSDQHLPHPARCPRDHNPRCLAHIPLLQPRPGLAAWCAIGKALLQRPVFGLICTAMAKNIHHSGRGPSQRQLRVGELIRRTLAEVLNRGDIHDPDLNRMSITVGEVRTSPDLRIATAYVLPLGGEGRDEALAALRQNRHELRRVVSKGLALKFSPELRFALDETFDRMDDTRRLLAQDDVRRDLDRDEEP